MDRHMTKSLTVLHCASCDSCRDMDNFLEWLTVLEAGSKVSVSDTPPYLTLKNVQRNLECTSCAVKGIHGSVTMVVFEWGN